MLTPTLGLIIKGLRLGYGWLPEKACWMKIQGDGPFKITLRTTLPNPRNHRGNESHRVWWSDPTFKERLLACPAFQNLQNQSTSFEIDEEGNKI